MHRHNKYIGLGFVFLMLVAAGCSGEQHPPRTVAKGASKEAPDPAQPSPQKTPPETSHADGSPGTGSAPDPGPELKQRTGRPDVDVKPTIKAKAEIASEGDAFYASIPLKLDHLVTHVRIKGSDVHGIAVPNASADKILARFVGRPSTPFELEVLGSTSRYNGMPLMQPVRVTSLDETMSGGALREPFFRAAGRWFENRGNPGWGRRSPFYSFAASRLQLMSYEGDPTRANETERPHRRTEAGELMALYTGMTSVEEALQADRGLLMRGGAAAGDPVALKDIEPVALAAHPWDSMIDALGGADAVHMEPLADAVPDDVIYVHFSDLRDLVGLARDMDEWISPAAQALEAKPGQSYMFDRYQTQLAIERTGLSETLGHLAADGVALVASDPFLREGTDVSIVFRVKSQELLDSALAQYEATYRERFPGLEKSTTTIAGKEVQLMMSPDGEVRQHRLKLGDNLIISNSPYAIERFVKVHEGKLPALSSAGDFRYMRALYPWHGAEGDDHSGFVFIGDSLVASTISPKRRILQGRRMAAKGDLMAVNNAVLLYGWLEGKAPDGVDDVVAAGYLQKSELKHADGSKIEFDFEHGAHSERWGSLTGMTPLGGMELRDITREEANAYAAFRDTYQSYWRTYIDPIAVQLTRTDNGGVEIDGRMLPLIARSEYSDLIRMIGNGRVMRPPFDAAVQWTMAIGQQSELRSDLASLGVWVGLESAVWDWVGDWVVIGTPDRSGLWDMVLALGEVPENGKRRNDDAEILAAMDRLPMFLAVQVTDKDKLSTTLGAIRTLIEKEAPGIFTWSQDETHRGVDIYTMRADEGAIDGIPHELTIHHAVADDVFLLCFDRETLMMQIDAVLDGGDQWQLDGSGEQEQVSFLVTPDPDAGWLEKSALGVSGKDLIDAHEMTELAWGALARGLRDRWTDDEDSQRQLGLALMGYAPTSIQGGVLQLKDDLVEDTVYGNVHQRRYPDVPVDGAPLSTAFEDLKQLDMAMSFEDFQDSDGEQYQGLHVRVTLDRRP